MFGVQYFVHRIFYLSNLTVHAVFDFWFDIVDMIFFFGQIDMI